MNKSNNDNNNSKENELEETKRKIKEVEEDINEVKARVKELEKKEELTVKEEKELEQKLSIYDKLLAKDVELRKEKARLEEQRSKQGLVDEFAAMSLESKKCKIVIEDFEKRDKGDSVILECMEGDDFFPEAKKFVREKFKVPSNDEVFFCCYVRGVTSRVPFRNADGYWGQHCHTTSCVYFWTGEQPVSPPVKIAELEQRQERMERDWERDRERMERDWERDRERMERRMRFLEVTSSSAQVKEERWQKAGMIHIEEMQKSFVSMCTVDMKGNDPKKLVKKPKNEDEVQKLWVELMPLVPLKDEGVVVDCSKVGIQFGGRSHDIDFVVFARKGVKAMEYVDTPIELKKSIKNDAERRGVVLQLLERMDFVFDAQPARQTCWGVALDASNVLFVKCNRALDYGVTPTLDLWEDGGYAQLLWNFLGASNLSRGYVSVELPILWGKEAEGMLSRSGSHCVFRLFNGCAAKVGEEEIIEKELKVMKSIQQTCGAGLIIPGLHEADLRTKNDKYPCGFQMDLHLVVSVSNEDELCSLLQDIFWRLGVLHACGMVHNDVKPSNMLKAEGGVHLLCDLGNALYWKEGDKMTTQRGATEAFKVMEGAFEKSGSSMFACDMEGLFWSILTLWLKVIRNRKVVPRLSASDRMNLLGRIQLSGGVFEERQNLELIKPESPMIINYFGQVKGESKLWEPLSMFQEFLKLCGGKEKEWKAAVAVFVKDKGLPCCPDNILTWVWNNRSLLSK